MEWLRLARTSENHFVQCPSSGRVTCITSVLNTWISWSLQTRLPATFTSPGDVAFPYLCLWDPAQHFSMLPPLSLGSEIFISAPQKPPELLIKCYFVPPAVIWEISLAWGQGPMTVMLLPATCWSVSTCSSWREPEMVIHYNVPSIVCSRQLAKHLSAGAGSLSDYIKCVAFLCSMVAVFLRVNLMPVFYHAVVAFRQVTGRQKALCTWNSNHNILICLLLLF